MRPSTSDPIAAIPGRGSPPKAPSRVLQWSELHGVADPQHQRRLTLVLAPPGYGKTTLLRQLWQRNLAAAHPAAWISLRFDDTAQTFTRVLVEHSLREHHAPLFSLRRPGGRMSSMLAALDNLSAATTVFVDGYSKSTDESIRALLKNLLTRHRDDLSIIIGASSASGLPVASMKGHDQLTVITARELSFDLTRTQLFLTHVLGLSLDPSTVRELHALTDGWPVGLRLATSVDPQVLEKTLCCPRNTRLIDRFFADSVLATLNAAQVEQLAQLSNLRSWRPDLCESLLGSRFDPSLLEHLQLHQQFVFEGADGTLSPHPMFRACLQRLLSRGGSAAVKRSHRHAAKVLSSCEEWPDAVDQALAAGDIRSAADWAARCAVTVAHRGDLARLRGWLKSMPDDEIYARPRLCLAAGLAYYGSRKPEQALRFLAAGAHTLESSRNDADGEEPQLLHEILLLKTFYPVVLDDSDAALQALGEADCASSQGSDAAVNLCNAWCTLYQRGTAAAALVLGETRGPVGESPTVDLHRLHLEGLIARLAGDLHQSESLSRELHRGALRTQGSASPMAALAAAGLARHAYEWDQLEVVDSLLAGRLATLLECGSVEGMMTGYFALIRRQIVDKAHESAFAALSDLEDFAIERRLYRLSAFCRSERALLHLLIGDLAKAQYCAKEAAATVDFETPPTNSIAAASRRDVVRRVAQVMITTGEPDRAIEQLIRIGTEWARLGFHYELASVQSLLACAHHQVGRRRAAERAAAAALAIGERSGLLRTFSDCGPGLALVLADLRRTLRLRPIQRPSLSYVERVLDFLHRSTAEPTSISSLAQGSGLSAREAEIVSLIGLGMSNKEIGRSLKLSSETVKWHLRQVFEKLKVTSRTEAVRALMRECGKRPAIPARLTALCVLDDYPDTSRRL